MHLASVGASGDGHAPAPPELDQALFAEQAQRSQNGVAVHPQYCGKVSSRRKPLSGLRLPFGDGSSNVSCHLVVKGQGVLAIDLDNEHGASYNIIISEAPMTLDQVKSPLEDRAAQALIEEARDDASVAVVGGSERYSPSLPLQRPSLSSCGPEALHRPQFPSHPPRRVLQQSPAGRT